VGRADAPAADTRGSDCSQVACRFPTVLTMTAEVGPRGDLARVRWVSPDGYRLMLDYRNGQTATVDGSQPFDFRPGAVLLVRADDDHLEEVDGDVWPEPSEVAVVRLRDGETTVLDTGGRLRVIEGPSAVDYQQGNTVEVKESRGIVRVLSPDPIRFLDLPVIDDAAVSSFRVREVDSPLSFEDFGGLRDIVERARELIEIPLQHHEQLKTIGARAIKGVLFTGDPGTGKTMLARIIASQAEAAFYEVSGPQIFSKWYGQSEELLRKLFEDAAQQERAIIFFDEIDSVAAQRDEDAHEASKRVVAQLLTLMDGFSRDQKVVVIATTNRPQDIDVALLRPGRFDWEIHFPLPALDDREQILIASARKLATTDPLPHRAIAAQTEGWSAAELTAIWTEAALFAVTDDRAVLMAEDYIAGFEAVRTQRSKRRSGGGS
jgi:transitional endoplasmic reticulum ATPase